MKHELQNIQQHTSFELPSNNNNNNNNHNNNNNNNNHNNNDDFANFEAVRQTQQFSLNQVIAEGESGDNEHKTTIDTPLNISDATKRFAQIKRQKIETTFDKIYNMTREINFSQDFYINSTPVLTTNAGFDFQNDAEIIDEIAKKVTITSQILIQILTEYLGSLLSSLRKLVELNYPIEKMKKKLTSQYQNAPFKDWPKNFVPKTYQDSLNKKQMPVHYLLDNFPKAWCFFQLKWANWYYYWSQQRYDTSQCSAIPVDIFVMWLLAYKALRLQQTPVIKDDFEDSSSFSWLSMKLYASCCITEAWHFIHIPDTLATTMTAEITLPLRNFVEGTQAVAKILVCCAFVLSLPLYKQFYVQQSLDQLHPAILAFGCMAKTPIPEMDNNERMFCPVSLKFVKEVFETFKNIHKCFMKYHAKKDVYNVQEEQANKKEIKKKIKNQISKQKYLGDNTAKH